MIKASPEDSSCWIAVACLWNKLSHSSARLKMGCPSCTVGSMIHQAADLTGRCNDLFEVWGILTWDGSNVDRELSGVNANVRRRNWVPFEAQRQLLPVYPALGKSTHPSQRTMVICTMSPPSQRLPADSPHCAMTPHDFHGFFGGVFFCSKINYPQIKLAPTKLQ